MCTQWPIASSHIAFQEAIIFWARFVQSSGHHMMPISCKASQLTFCVCVLSRPSRIKHQVRWAHCLNINILATAVLCISALVLQLRRWEYPQLSGHAAQCQNIHIIINTFSGYEIGSRHYTFIFRYKYVLPQLWIIYIYSSPTL